MKEMLSGAFRTRVGNSMHEFISPKATKNNYENMLT
eukprot:CAMPEP_0201242312 /NCGR_PEP_ID=MMETSP0852-20130820/37432_1 /ASSEMBLY_ACC=CAM_ASM_000632 /TAXON_ID=183588 /ORGANISM="Pseudo-nitzschia fraudulenta, Strain WWA7" /LENGTH=35 /DNA_ID= /DNA_START= /DNA_END= /DNA_ORIENTATION=